MRLLPSEDVAEVGEAPVKLTNGHEAHVTMHMIEGSKEEIEKQLRTSLEAFFDLYPVHSGTPVVPHPRLGVNRCDSNFFAVTWS